MIARPITTRISLPNGVIFMTLLATAGTVRPSQRKCYANGAAPQAGPFPAKSKRLRVLGQSTHARPRFPGHRHREAAAAPHLARHLQRRAHALREVFRDREPEAGASELAAARLVD